MTSCMRATIWYKLSPLQRAVVQDIDALDEMLLAYEGSVEEREASVRRAIDALVRARGRVERRAMLITQEEFLGNLEDWVGLKPTASYKCSGDGPCASGEIEI